jgi:hypothetical protein
MAHKVQFSTYSTIPYPNRCLNKYRGKNYNWDNTKRDSCPFFIAEGEFCCKSTRCKWQYIKPDDFPLYYNQPQPIYIEPEKNYDDVDLT